ncbi:MAG: immunoglobulin-like domain-containing protein, partial [Opitutae bacterium]
GAIWHDSLDGNGTADANGTVDHLVPGTYQITYNYTDSSGNAAQQVVRTVNVVDTTPPVITLIGDANVTHLASSEYFDEGATWSDIVDGNGTADANGSVDSNTPGIYKIIYTKTDANGNAAEPVVRTVSVIQENRAPESMTLSQAYIAENLPENSLVGYFNAFDPDENDVLTYRFFSLDQSDNDTLEHNHSLPIDENSTDLEEFVYDSSEQSIDTTNDLPFILKENGTLLTARMLDYESDPKFFDLHVIVHDQKGASYEQTFVISLINIIEDMDGDGVEDAFDSDRDGDGINNEDEVLAGTDPDNQYSRTNKPIVNSDEGHMDENGTIHLSGEVLFNGDGQIKDFGFVLSSGLSLNRSKSTVYWVRGVGEPNQFSLKVTASPFPRVMYFRSWARNAAGYGIGPVKKVIIPEAPQLWWGEITEEVGGWKSSSWFGTFMYYEKGWLFHAQLGWLYSSGLDNQSVWLWTEHHGWLWTKEGVWPYLFKNDSASWIYFTTTQNGIPLFYDYLTSSYLGLEHQPVNQAE